MLWCLAHVASPAGMPGCAARNGVETGGLGVPRVKGVCEGETGEDTRPRARAGAGGIHWMKATTAESCHHFLVFHRPRP